MTPAEQLIESARRSDLTLLPDLVAAELCALSGLRRSLVDERLFHTWGALTPEARRAFTADALAALVSRGLLEPDRAPAAPADAEASRSPERYRMHPALGVIVAAQARPTWLAVSSIATTPHAGPRLYGVGDRHDPLQAAVLEVPRDRPEDADDGDTDGKRLWPQTLATVYQYALVSTSKAAYLLAGWAILPVPHRSIAHETPPRIVDIYSRSHTQDRPLTRQRIAVRCRGGRARIAVGEGTPNGLSHDAEYDRAGLAEVLHRRIEDVCGATAR